MNKAAHSSEAMGRIMDFAYYATEKALEEIDAAVVHLDKKQIGEAISMAFAIQNKLEQSLSLVRATIALCVLEKKL